MHPVWRRFLPLLPFLLAVFAWHVWDTARQGGPVWVPILASVVPLGILGGLGFFASRPVPGMSEKEAQAHRVGRLQGLARWAALVAVVVAALRLVAYVAERK